MATLRSSIACLLACLAACPALAEPIGQRAEFLVARKNLPDPNFHDAVVLLTEHGATGALGFIVNHPADVTLAKALPDVKRAQRLEDKVYVGGPVMREIVVFVFRSPTPHAGATQILDGVLASSSATLLDELLQRDKPTEGLRVFAGLAGWGPGQLESEIARGDWRLIPADADSIFDDHPATLWGRLYRRAFAVQVRNGRTSPVLAATVGR